jgi:diguanylate cyclase (GGDEF)-like protein
MAYNIAFLTYDWNNEITGQFTQGIHCFIKDHPDVNVHVFTGFGSYRIAEEERPALQIFNLPYLTQYDGVVLQSNRNWNQKQKGKLVERACAQGVPVVSINYPIEGTVMVGTDNYQISYELTEHLITEHHCRSIAVIAGLPTSQESQTRKQAIIDCCEKHGIENVRIYGNAWNEKYGVQAAQEMIAEDAVPEGIVCANDHLAYGAEKELIKNGIRVPEDVKITGFDNVSLSVAAPVRITTVDRDYPGMVYTALDVVMSLIDGCEIHDEIYTPAQIKYSCSCGCAGCTNEMDEIKERFLKANSFITSYNKLYKLLSMLLDKAGSIADIAEIIEHNAKEFKSGDIYIVLNGLYLENFGNTNPIRHYGDHMVLVAMSQKDTMQCDEKHIYETFSRELILPEEILQHKKMLQVYSLQAEETCIGYVVTDGISAQTEYNFLETAFSLLSNSIERVRRASVMESLNSRLSKMYITDPLTGLYNRFGLEQKGRLLYDQLMKAGKKAYICFIDIDNLKKINDVYGHECGDDAIIRTSQMISKGLKNAMSFAMRYGGDEFVALGDASMINDLKAEQEELQEKEQRYPYQLSASIGEFAVDSERALTLQEAIEHADDIMYEAKKKKKMGRTD